MNVAFDKNKLFKLVQNAIIHKSNMERVTLNCHKRHSYSFMRRSVYVTPSYYLLSPKRSHVLFSNECNRILPCNRYLGLHLPR